MEALDSGIAKGIVEHLKKEVLSAVPTQIDQLNSDGVEALRKKLHVLHYYCLQREIDPKIVGRLGSVHGFARTVIFMLHQESSKILSLGRIALT